MCVQRKLLVVDPGKRMTADEALRHPWLQAFAERMPHEMCVSPGAKATACHQQTAEQSALHDSRWRSRSRQRRQIH